MAKKRLVIIFPKGSEWIKKLLQINRTIDIRRMILLYAQPLFLVMMLERNFTITKLA
jgi:hypothetical protein